MKAVPDRIDGALVLFSACSGSAPFFIMPGTGEEVYGLAICQYEGSADVYRFSCDANWQCLSDLDYPELSDALKGPSGNYDIEQVIWLPVVR